MFSEYFILRLPRPLASLEIEDMIMSLSHRLLKAGRMYRSYILYVCPVRMLSPRHLLIASVGNWILG